MTWDFAEANIFGNAAGDYQRCIGSLCEVVASIDAKRDATVSQANAATSSLAPRSLISTDPPYYDNVPYADLSDFFYVWLRRSLDTVHPKLLSTVLVPKAEELVADAFRHGSKESACRFFEEGMGRVFQRIREVSDPRFPTTIYYAFKQVEGDSDEEESAEITGRASTGWQTFLQSLIDTGWHIDGTWPLRTELGSRMRNLESNALASSIVLACRPLGKHAQLASRRDFLSALRRELPEPLRLLQKGNIPPVDLAQAAIGPGMAIFSRYAKVLENDGEPMKVRTALV